MPEDAGSGADEALPIGAPKEHLLVGFCALLNPTGGAIPPTKATAESISRVLI